MPDRPKFGDPNYNIVWDNLSWEETPRTVVIGLTGLIPEVGGAFSKALSMIWPDPKSAQALIEQSEKKMKAWVSLEIENQIAQYDTEKLRDRLAGLKSNLRYYDNAIKSNDINERKQWLSTCIASFNEVEPFFLNPKDYHGSLPLIQELGTLHIVLLLEPVRYFDQIFGSSGTAANREFHEENLTAKIKTYQDFVIQQACPKILESRRKQIYIKSPDWPDTSYRLVDEGRKVNERLNQIDIANQYKEYFVNELELKLQKDVIDVALTWSALDPNSPVKEPIPKSRTILVGPVGISQWDYTSHRWGGPLVNGPKSVQSPIKNILLKHGVILDFIWLRDDGTKRDSQGNLRGLMVGNDRGGDKVEFSVPAGEFISQVDTYWNYVCMAIEFHYTDGSSSGVFGNADPAHHGTHVFKAAYPDHILGSIAVYGATSGIAEFYFGFSPNPKAYT